ncbi:hypothetical protein BN1708_019879 [Verticillium longisporum]|uniref:Uncharacterized protein n=1 Tax=Verticillium longisporum TaxID=100787 RepID=A0A0G4MNW4_VERLO|nr:hypothetical protein BN1708_019879 [Verticillium longisporum]
MSCPLTIWTPICPMPHPCTDQPATVRI